MLQVKKKLESLLLRHARSPDVVVFELIYQLDTSRQASGVPDISALHKLIIMAIAYVNDHHWTGAGRACILRRFKHRILVTCPRSHLGH